MSRNPLEAYKSVEKATLTGRELEASVLTKAALALVECRNRWDTSDRDARLDEALKLNQRVWSFFQAELMQETNPLPAGLKRNILLLSAFVDRRIFEVMAYPEKEKLEVLININRNIAAGLRGDPG